MRKAWLAREARQDYRAALIATLLANAHRDPKRKPQPFTPADFFPSLKPSGRRGRMSNEEIMAAARRIVGKPPPSKRKASN